MLRWLPFILLFNPFALISQTSLHTRLIGQMEFGKFTNDVWGYVDASGRDYAIVGHIDGVSFVRVTDTGLALVSFIEGERSTWRDIKTHGHYAYVTNETGGGLDIFDLTGLPDNVRFVKSDSSVFNRAHNLYISEGYAYISGSDIRGGAEILNLANPERPSLVGEWSEEYFHDIFVLGDRLFGSAGGESKIVVLDISNKARPSRIADLPFPDGGYSHNAWATADGRYLMTTQETTDLTVKVWDIMDLSNPVIVGEYLSLPGRLAHNTHIYGDFAYISHYADGLRIVDISDPEYPVEVGYYDTHESTSPGFTGNWGAFPFTQSGFVYASDEDNGLFVVDFDRTRAVRLSGSVRDVTTGEPIKNAVISVNADVAAQAETDSSGNYRLGFPGSGSYAITASSFFHNPRKLQLVLNEGDSKNQDWLLTRKPLADLTIGLRDAEGAGIPDVTVVVADAPYGRLVSDASGRIEIRATPAGTYKAVFYKWAYQSSEEIFEVAGGTSNPITVVLEQGVSDDFEYDLGWQTDISGGEPLGSWQRARRADIPIAVPFVPATSEEFPASSYVYYARMFRGAAYLTSRPFTTNSNLPMAVQYSYHWYPQGGNNDSLQVEVSLDEGEHWLQIGGYGDGDLTDGWGLDSFALPALQPGSEMMLRFVVREKGTQAAYAVIDNLEIVNRITSVEARTPELFQLLQNYPNPFNHSTSIPFSTTTSGEIRLEVFNLRGERIRVLRSGFLTSGFHSARWDGTDDNGKMMASGLYLFRLFSGARSQSKMMIFLK